MRQRLLSIGIVVTLCIGLAAGYLAGRSGIGFHVPGASAADDCATFPQTGKTVCEPFLSYWRSNGGLAQQGLPLSDAFFEKSDVDGKVYKVQYFERAVFELHPENQPPYNVLLSLLGREKFLAKYPNGQPPSAPPPAPQPSPSPAPPASIVGQTIQFPASFGSGTLQGTVTDFEQNVSLTDLGGSPIKPSGVFVAVFMRVTNPGKTSASVSSINSFVLVDRQNRQFDMADVDAQIAASAQYHRQSVYDDIQPSLSVDAVFIFDVAPDAAGFHVTPVAP